MMKLFGLCFFAFALSLSLELQGSEAIFWVHVLFVSVDALRCSPGRYPNITHQPPKCQPCDRGRYGLFGAVCKNGHCVGDVTKLCTGPCAEGFICPLGSSSPKQDVCGGAHLFCPEGSSEPQLASPGYYTYRNNTMNGLRATSLLEYESYDEGGLYYRSENSVKARNNALFLKREDEMHRTGQLECEPGYWCKDGMRYPCSESGSYGIFPGLKSSSCNGPCPIGHYCSQESSYPIKCPPGTFNNKTGITNSSCTGLCSPGFYCEAGSTSSTQSPCPAGIAGTDAGLKNDKCSLNCDITGKHCIVTPCRQGYYCPQNSSSPYQMQCGGPHFYCPEGSSSPTIVSSGHYTVGNISVPAMYQSIKDSLTRYDQVKCEKGTYCTAGTRYPCPAGTFGNESGLITPVCSGVCKAGYFCHMESLTEKDRQCGSPAVFCPSGSALPTPVSNGYYSNGGSSPNTQISQSICPPGYYCVDGLKRPCPAGTYGQSYGLTSPECDGPSDPGYYTPSGSASSKQIACPAGRYGVHGMENDKCQGAAKEGYYTKEASTSPTQIECGDDMVYCPEGSPHPLNVTEEFYAVGGSATTRSSQRRCEPENRRHPNNPKGIGDWCPSSTLSSETIKVDVDYHIDPEDKYQYDVKYNASIYKLD